MKEKIEYPVNFNMGTHGLRHGYTVRDWNKTGTNLSGERERTLEKRGESK